MSEEESRWMGVIGRRCGKRDALMLLAAQRLELNMSNTNRHLRVVVLRHLLRHCCVCELARSCDCGGQVATAVQRGNALSVLSGYTRAARAAAEEPQDRAGEQEGNDEGTQAGEGEERVHG